MRFFSTLTSPVTTSPRHQSKSLIRTQINEAFNKQKVIRRLYKIVTPYTHNIYRDDNWSGVSDIINALKDAGYTVAVSVENGGYRNSLGGNSLYPHKSDVSYWKEYKLEIPVEEGRVIN